MDSKKDQPKHWYSPDPYFGFRVTYRYEEIDKEIDELRRLALGFQAQEQLYAMTMAKIDDLLKWKKEAEPTVLAHRRQMAGILVCQNNSTHIGDSGTGIITDHSYPKRKR